MVLNFTLIRRCSMRVVVQRVKEAAVSIGGIERVSIGKGFLLLVGIGKSDTPETIERMAGKISRLRIFEDEQGKMNLDIRQVAGEILSVSQFTLLGNTSKGNRPGFDDAADPVFAKELWEGFNDALIKEGVSLKAGEFGARMEIGLVNDGPVTFIL